MESRRKTILLTGATGYVGGRLLPLLEERGYHVRCLVRQPAVLQDRVRPPTEVVQGDLCDEASLAHALEGIDQAIYLVHSMGSPANFAEQDRQLAHRFATAAYHAGVQRLVYLGGLGNSAQSLSQHLRSRQETGAVLRSAGVPVIELRASIIIGSGSASFEMIRALVERLPIMICPQWVRVRSQPIAIEDVLAYLLEAIELDLSESRIFEIGGPDQMSYGQLMQEYAKQRGLTRWMIPVPLLTPYLSSLWLGLVTPLYARIGRKLVDSLRNETVVVDSQAEEVFTVRPRSVSEAIARARIQEDQQFAATRWSDALSSAGVERSWGGIRFGSRLVDSRVAELAVPRRVLFEPVQRIGGKTGWYYGNWLWRVRGGLDLLVGGVGIRRGRRHPVEIRVGDPLDFWRVEAFEPNRRLRLCAEMKLPGRAWLEFEVTGNETASTLRQTALFDPVGLWGLVYWYSLFPLHEIVFAGMLRNLVATARVTMASNGPLLPQDETKQNATNRSTTVAVE